MIRHRPAPSCDADGNLAGPAQRAGKHEIRQVGTGESRAQNQLRPTWPRISWLRLGL